MPPLDSESKSRLAIASLEGLKGQDVVLIDVSRLTDIADYMIIASGRSTTHINALADAVRTELKKAGQQILGVEGREHAEWVLVDGGDVLVHVMSAAARATYKLEDLWQFSPAAARPRGGGDVGDGGESGSGGESGNGGNGERERAARGASRS